MSRRLKIGLTTIERNNIFFSVIIYTGGTVRAKKLSLKSLTLSGLFGAKCSLPQKSFSWKQSNRPNEILMYTNVSLGDVNKICFDDNAHTVH